MIKAVFGAVLMQKMVFIGLGFSSNSPRWVGGALQEKTALYYVFCLPLVRHVLSQCCRLCSWQCMAVVLSNCVQSFLRVLVEHLRSEGDDLMELSLFKRGSRFEMLGRCFLDSFGARARADPEQPKTTQQKTLK